MPTYTDILAGLTTRFQTVSGLTVLDHEPTSVHSDPLLYSLFERYTIDSAGQIDKHVYRVLHRVCVAWQDNQGAEQALQPFLEAIPAAVNADPRLGGTLTQGYARIVECTGVYVVIGTVLCRGYDFISESFYKAGRT